MICVSTFTLRGRIYPEVDAYQYVEFDNADKLVTSNMWRVLSKTKRDILWGDAY